MRHTREQPRRPADAPSKHCRLPRATRIPARATWHAPACTLRTCTACPPLRGMEGAGLPGGATCTPHQIVPRRLGTSCCHPNTYMCHPPCKHQRPREKSRPSERIDASQPEHMYFMCSGYTVRVPRMAGPYSAAGRRSSISHLMYTLRHSAPQPSRHLAVPTAAAATPPSHSTRTSPRATPFFYPR